MTTTKNAGRPRKPPATSRGRLILEALDAQGLTLHAAAKKAGISFDALYRVIHENDPGWLQVHAVEAVCRRLGLAIELVAPKLAKLASPGVEPPNADQP